MNIIKSIPEAKPSKAAIFRNTETENGEDSLPQDKAHQLAVYYHTVRQLKIIQTKHVIIMYLLIHKICMHIYVVCNKINEKDAINLKETKEGYCGRTWREEREGRIYVTVLNILKDNMREWKDGGLYIKIK